MSKEKTEEITYRVPWVFIVVYTIILTTILSLLTLFVPMPWACVPLGPIGFGYGYDPVPLIAMFFFFPLITYGVLEKLGVKLDRRTMAVMFITSSMVSLHATYRGTLAHLMGYMHARLENPAIHGVFLPSFWMPSAEAIKSGYFPGGAIYWNEWIPVFAFRPALAICFSLLIFSYVVILSRLWIEIEVLPFPLAQGWLVPQLALRETNSHKKIAFFAATLITYLFLLPYPINAAFPAFPDLYGWTKNPFFLSWVPGHVQIMDMYPILRTSIVGKIFLATNPMWYAVIFLAPMSTLTGGAVGYLTMWIIIPQILYYFGYYSGALAAGSTWDKTTMIMTGEPLKLGAFSAVGMLFSLFAIHIVVNWRYLVGTLKTALGMTSVGLEEQARILRIAYILLPVGLVGVLGLLGISGIGLAAGIVLLAYMTIICTVYARSVSYAGVGVSGSNGEGIGWKPLATLLYGPGDWVQGNVTQEQMMAGMLGTWSLVMGHSAEYSMGPYSWGFQCFKVGSVGGLKNMTILKTMLLVTVMAAVLSPIVTVVGWHYYGLMVAPISKEWDWMWQGDAGVWNSYPAQGVWWPWSVAGFIFGTILSFLRMRFAWFPIDPYGFLLATAGEPGVYIGMGEMMCITLVVKYIVMKIGGVKVYEEYGIPAAIGVMTAYGLMVVSIGIAYLFRWYVPV